MMTNRTHLTALPADITLVAWHGSEDIQAVRLPAGTELLVVGGHVIPLEAWMHGPVQQVINYCGIGKRAQKICRAMWEAKRTEAPLIAIGGATKSEG